MPSYQVNVTEIYYHTYDVEANSPSAAKKKVLLGYGRGCGDVEFMDFTDSDAWSVEDEEGNFWDDDRDMP